MLVKYKYDDETEKNIKRFKSYLAEYEKLLIAKLKEEGLENTGNGYPQAFYDDTGRKSILEEITKIRSLAVPVSIEFIGF